MSDKIAIISADGLTAMIDGVQHTILPVEACVHLWQMEKENTALLETIRQYDHVIQAVATALGGVCCGGIDVDGPGSTEQVLVSAIEQLCRRYDERGLYLQDAEARIHELMAGIVRK